MLLFASSCIAEQANNVQPQYDIWEYEVRGNTLLDQDEIQRTIYGFLGDKKTTKDLEAARVSLENLYRSKGYPSVLVNIPEQNVDEALVNFNIIEGKVANVKISGSRYFLLSDVKKSLPVLAKGQIPYLPSLKKQMSDLNGVSSDRYVNPVLRPGKQIGTIDVELKIKDNLPLHGYVELNNKHGSGTNELRSEASITYSNLWQKSHSLSLMFQTTPENTKEVSVYSANYLMRWRQTNSMTAMYMFSTNSNISAAGDISVIGKGTVSGVRHIIPFQSLNGHRHNVKFGYDYKDFSENILIDTGEEIKTPIDYFVLSASYSDSYFSKFSLSQFELGINWSTRGMGNKLEEFENKWFKTNPNFYYLNANGLYQHMLPLKVKFRLKSKAQFTHQALVPNEQFTVGGVDSVRGYLSSSASGENGIQLSIEFETPNITRYFGPVSHKLSGMIFSDVARLWRIYPLAGEAKRFFLLSSGGGLSYNYKSLLQANLVVAAPLWDGEVSINRPIVHFSIRSSF